MSWRDLKPLDDRYELERPAVVEAINIYPDGDKVTLTFTDPLSREWMAEWLRSRRGWAAFMTWVDEKR